MHQGLDIGFNNPHTDRMTKLYLNQSSNRQSLGDLLIGFFVYYTYIFDWDKQVISIRKARALPIVEWLEDVLEAGLDQQFKLPKDIGQQLDNIETEGDSRTAHIHRSLNQFAFIEDPFEIRNLAKNISRGSITLIKNEIRQASDWLLKGQSLQTLLEERDQSSGRARRNKYKAQNPILLAPRLRPPINS